MAGAVIHGISQTEKGKRLEAMGQYVLEVSPRATKPQIRQAVEAMFKVDVTAVNTQNFQGKWRRLTGRWGRRPAWKRAIVTLAKGQKLELK
jgi:large subunit ribosomal protein L23